MALKKPIVITAGQFEQLQAGDRIATPDLFSRTNGNASPIVIGQPVHVDAPGSCDLAQADAAATKDVLGLVADTSIPAGAPGSIQSDGVLVASTAQWDAVTGQTGGLTSGAKYFLDAVSPGKLTTVAPTADLQFVCPVGQALSTTEFEITIGPTVKL